MSDVWVHVTQDQAARLKRAGRRCTVLVCHEQTRRVAPPYLSVYILAGQLVKHLQALPHGSQLAAAAEVVTSYAVVEVPESSD